MIRSSASLWSCKRRPAGCPVNTQCWSIRPNTEWRPRRLLNSRLPLRRRRRLRQLRPQLQRALRRSPRKSLIARHRPQRQRRRRRSSLRLPRLWRQPALLCKRRLRWQLRLRLLRRQPLALRNRLPCRRLRPLWRRDQSKSHVSRLRRRQLPHNPLRRNPSSLRNRQPSRCGPRRHQPRPNPRDRQSLRRNPHPRPFRRPRS